MKKLLLVDGNSMLFRAYYATAYGARMTTSQGLPTNAVFGFANMLQKAIEMTEPDSILIAFDAGKHTFRHDLYPEYKGGRKPAPDDLVPQFGMVRDYLDAFGIRWVEMQDIEADDLIGTMSLQSPEYETKILSSDHDLLQLIDDTTHVLLMKKGLTEFDEMTVEKMKEEMGIEPLQIIDMKGLMGDHSDNIPGIPGVGEKTALKLLQQYGTVENVLEHQDELKGALQKKVIAGHDSALLSKRLATIQRDVTLDFTADDCAFRPDYRSLVRFCETLDMNSVANRYRALITDEEEESAAPAEAEALNSIETRVPESFYQADCAVFVDGTRDDFMTAQIRGFAVTDGKKACYIRLEDAKSDAAFLAWLKEGTAKKIGFDVKRNLHLLRNEGLEGTFTDDAMIIAALADSTLTSTDKIMERNGMSLSVTYEDVYGKANKPVLLPEDDKLLAYACESVRNIYMLYQNNIVRIREYGMEDLYAKVEMPLTLILNEMERVGIRCDIRILNRIADETFEKLTQEQDEIHRLAGRSFNINSPKQLAEVLYDDLGLWSDKKRSTSADKLEKLIDAHPIIAHILNYRKISKIYSTYAEGLKKYIRADGKIHTIYNQCATQTGRLSSSEPNLQNISVRDEQGKQIRKAFLPDEGHVLISSDYHQIELRMLADMANVESLIEAFREGIDIHTKTAMDVFGVSQEEVTPLMRRQAKTVNFGIVYGISDFGLAEQLGVSRKEAQQFIDSYYKSYPGIKTYMNSVIEECDEKGYVSTLLGRRREIPEIHDKNRMVREFGKRAAMNAPIQGSAADLIKLAMINIDRTMKEKNVASRMILQVHDELIFDVPEDEVETMKAIITEGMETAMELKVPLTVECSVGTDWYEAK